MADPNQPSESSGDSGRKEAEILASKLQDINKAIQQAAAQGGTAFNKALVDARKTLEAFILPSMYKMGTAAQISAKEMEKQFKGADIAAQSYYKAIGNEEKRLQTLRDMGVNQGKKAVTEYYDLQIRKLLELQAETGQYQEQLAEIGRLRDADMRRVEQKGKDEAGSGSLKNLLSLKSIVGTILGAVGADLVQQTAIDQFKTAGAFARAGGYQVGVGSRGTAQGATEAMLGGMYQGADAREALQMVAKAVTAAPALRGQSAEKFTALEATMGVDLPEAMDLAARASSLTNMSFDQLTESLKFSAAASRQFGLDSDTNMQLMINFTGALRKAGEVTKNAEIEARKWVATMEQAGTETGMSKEELTGFASKLSSAIQGMSPSHAAGLYGAVAGQLPTSWEQLKQVTTLGFQQKLYGKFANLGPTGELLKPEVMANMLGAGGLDIQQAQTFQRLMKGGASMEAISKQMELRPMEANVREGVQALRSMQDVATNSERHLSRIAAVVAGPVGQLLAHPVSGVVGSGLLAGGSVASLAAVAPAAAAGPLGWAALAMGVAAMGYAATTEGHRDILDIASNRKGALGD